MSTENQSRTQIFVPAHFLILLWNWSEKNLRRKTIRFFALLFRCDQNDFKNHEIVWTDL